MYKNNNSPWMGGSGNTSPLGFGHQKMTAENAQKKTEFYAEMEKKYPENEKKPNKKPNRMRKCMNITITDDARQKIKSESKKRNLSASQLIEMLIFDNL